MPNNIFSGVIFVLYWGNLPVILMLHWGYKRVIFVFLVVLRAAFLQTYLAIRDLDPQGLLLGTEKSRGLQDKRLGQGV